MRRGIFPALLRLVFLGCVFVLGAWVVASNLPAKEGGELHSVIGVQSSAQKVNSPQATVEQPILTMPLPEGTPQPPIPGITPTWPEPTVTPTPAIMQPATLVTSSIITTVTQDLNIRLELQRTVNTDEPIFSMAWAPTGDKLLYVTQLGKLYWSNLDGSNATLLHQYDELFRPLHDQTPLSNVLFGEHIGKEAGVKRLPSHTDVIKFTPGQPPTIEENYEVPYMWDVSWWSPDRASAVLGLHYLENAYYEGGDRLVTLDANGHIVEERNIPYMFSSAMQPGGEWLAYSTDPRTGVGPDPATTYLMNMTTGQRSQIAQSGEGGNARSWSPDGNWFIAGRGLVSADGREWVAIPRGLGDDVVWSPDSRYLAFSAQNGGCEPEGCTPYISQFYIVDVVARKMTEVGEQTFSPKLSGMVMHPRWSPDGSQLALMSFAPGCPGPNGSCSRTAPALYFVSVVK